MSPFCRNWNKAALSAEAPVIKTLTQGGKNFAPEELDRFVDLAPLDSEFSVLFVRETQICWNPFRSANAASCTN